MEESEEKPAQEENKTKENESFIIPMLPEAYSKLDKETQEKIEEMIVDIAFSITSEDTGMLKEDPEERLSDAEGFIDCAKREIKSLKANYEIKNYSKAVEALQQAVEKTTKAYGRYFFQIPMTELKNTISHRTPEIFLAALKIPVFQSLINLIQMVRPDLNSDTSPLEKQLKEEQLKIAQTPAKDIIKLLETLEKTRESMKQDEIDHSIAEGIEKVKSSGLVTDIKLNAKLDVADIISFVSLFVLSVITFSHFNYSRYPDRELKPKDYQEGMGIVDTIPKLVPYIEQAIDSFERLTAKEKP